MRPSHTETLHFIIREAERERKRLPIAVAEIAEKWALRDRVERLEAELIAVRSMLDSAQRILEAQARIQAQLMEGNETLGRQIAAERARFKIEKYLRIAYTIASERRMAGETAEAAFERLSSTRELKLAAQIAGENLVTLSNVESRLLLYDSTTTSP